MTELTKTDLHFVLTRVPKDIRQLCEKYSLMIGGGFIREIIAGNAPHDVDIFGSSKTVLYAAAMELEKDRAARKFSTANAITLLCPPRLPVQFITRWRFASLDLVVSSFDFTVCQAAIGFFDGKWQSVIAQAFYSDLAARRLVYTMPTREEAAGGSMMRVRKFLARGYNIQASSLAAVIARVMRAVDYGRLQGVSEQELGQILTGVLREVDPLLVLDGVEAVEDHV